ncbi:MAG TPA: SRPBCC family protein [Myxococcales bacterium]|nr:SRPBCC family protein [Myxococcales bacterium]
MAGETDRIQKQILLQAPRSRVWRALSDAKEFGSWFGMDLRGAFVPGARVRGRVTHPGYEHLTVDIEVERMEPERLFSWRWHPAPVEPGTDYSKEPTTLVVFELAEKDGGTLLTVVESGFDRLPAARRAQAYRLNEEGWAMQMTFIEKHLARAVEQWPAAPR